MSHQLGSIVVGRLGDLSEAVYVVGGFGLFLCA